MADSPEQGQECTRSPDGLHCESWQDGGKCHYCGAEAMSIQEQISQGMLRLEDIAAMKDELAKIAVAVGRSKTDGNDCDWFELAGDVAALAAGVPKGWDVYRLGNSDDLIVVSAPDGRSVTLSPQGTGLASQLLYQLATTLMGGPKS